MCLECGQHCFGQCFDLLDTLFTVEHETRRLGILGQCIVCVSESVVTGMIQQETSTVSTSLRSCVSESVVTSIIQQETSTVSTSLRLRVRVISDRHDTAGYINCFHFTTVMCQSQ